MNLLNEPEVRLVDPKPYKRHHPLRPRSNTLRSVGRRYAIEFWTYDGVHDFAYFFTAAGARHWAAMKARGGAARVS